MKKVVANGSQCCYGEHTATYLNEALRWRQTFSSTAANVDVCSPIPNYHYSYTALSGLKMWPGIYRRTLGDGISIAFPIPCFDPVCLTKFSKKIPKICYVCL